MLILNISSRKQTLEWKTCATESLPFHALCVFLRIKNRKLNAVLIITILKKEQEGVRGRTKAGSPETAPDIPHHVIALINYLISPAFIWHYVFMEWYPVVVHSALAEYA